MKTKIEGGSHANLERQNIYMRTVREDGKVQIPKGIRDIYKLVKGDTVIWSDNTSKDEVTIRFMSTTLEPKQRGE